MKAFLKLKLLFIATVFAGLRSAGQCSSIISTFPYNEDFEAGNGNWIPAGTASDWSWGAPLKPVIGGAASGSKCWIVGTLTQSSYSNNQNSTLTSPCFDFSSLTAPAIRFSIFWETEKKYDGASFQYSLDGGNSWTILGSYDPGACPGDNWYNTSGITALSSDGWSGNIQPTASCSGGAGNGSGEWKIARQHLMNLAGQPNVRFRFRFAAGSVCNNYDGFAIDDIWIGNQDPTAATFSYSCTSSNTVSLTPDASPCNATYSWDFGDPASGAANSSSQQAPSHNFSNAGQYTITLTIKDGAAPAVSSSQLITILDVTTQIITPINCFGDKASLQAQVNPAGAYTYEWNTSPPQSTATAAGLDGGSYTVQVSATGACPASDNITLVSPAPVSVFLGNDTVICSGQQLLLAPGTYSSYQWQDGSTAASYLVSQTGNFWVEVKNNAGCSASDSIRVIIDCSDIYFPSAFSPDQDGKNDRFGALGNIAGISEYSLKIYNRWGQLVFHTDKPSAKWDGTIRGKPAGPGAFVWFAGYTLQATRKRYLRKGTIITLR